MNCRKERRRIGQDLVVRGILSQGRFDSDPKIHNGNADHVFFRIGLAADKSSVRRKCVMKDILRELRKNEVNPPPRGFIDWDAVCDARRNPVSGSSNHSAFRLRHRNQYASDSVLPPHRQDVRFRSTRSPSVWDEVFPQPCKPDRRDDKIAPATDQGGRTASWRRYIPENCGLTWEGFPIANCLPK